MNITIAFFIGLFVALIGVIPPGLLNMTAARISLKEGYSRGIVFSIGVCIIVFVQTYIAAIFASFLSEHPDVVEILQRVAFVIFVLITIYFLVIARSKNEKPIHEDDTRSKRSRFFYGMFLSALNVFPIPYQAYMTITLGNLGFISFDTIGILTYVTGAAMGTFVMLYIYIFFFDKIKDKQISSQKSMNYCIGALTGLVALITLFNIISDL